MNQCPICGADRPEGQLFCANCGTSLVQIESEQPPVPPPVVKRSNAPLVIAIITAAVAVGVTFFLYQDMSAARSQLYQTEIELSETREKNRQLGSELSEAQSELLETQSELSATLIELSETRSDLSETRSELDKLDNLIGVYGYGSENFYALKSVVLLRKSEKKYVTIYSNLYATLTFHNSNSGVKGEWDKEWSANGTQIQIALTGNSAGYYTVQFTNSVNNDSFEILVIVTD